MITITTFAQVMVLFAKTSSSSSKTSMVLDILNKIPTWTLRAKELPRLKQIIEALRTPQATLKEWRGKYKLIHALGDWFTFGHSLGALSTHKPSRKVIFTPEAPVILTMTSCKRLDLLSRTIDSMLDHILDLQKHVREWIVIDDNSSINDRNKMKCLYPFITFMDKSEADKGHPRSMNILRSTLLQTNARFVLHVEDDWEFWYPDEYISKCLEVFQSSKEPLGQVLVNFEYAEDQRTAQDIWNRDMHYTSSSVRYFIHEYFTGLKLAQEEYKLEGRASMYWPHFSFRVGLTDLDVFRTIGEFNETANHFELEYAHRYVEKGYKTASLDGCYCTHIGRRTYEKNTDKLNAYDLNQEHQFVGKEKQKQQETNIPVQRIQTYVINLARRPERLLKFVALNNQEMQSYEIVDAVDGSVLQPDIKLQKLFETGDYHFRRGIVGCAYSHLKIWAEFLKTPGETCVVLEDDVQLCHQFSYKLMHLLNTCSFDLMFLHWNANRGVNNENWKLNFTKPIGETWTVQESILKNMGSGAAYVLTRKAAKHLLNWVNVHGMPNAVDWVLMKQPDLTIMYSKPMLAFASCVQENQTVPSDIQHDYASVGFSTPSEELKAEFERWGNGVVHQSTYESKDWSYLKSKVVVIHKDIHVPIYLPVKWYLVGESKIVVPDIFLTSKLYSKIPWFSNRLNFNSV